MSYASVTASSTPYSEQPHPDPSLLNSTPSTASNVVDDTSKVNVAAPDFKQHPATTTSEIYDDSDHSTGSGSRSPTQNRRLAKRFQEAEAEGVYLWDTLKYYLLRPGVAGGLLGVVNVGLLAGTARAFYLRPDFRRDTRLISSTVAAAIAVLSVEGYTADWYRRTERGKKEERRAKQEGSLLYQYTREHIFRPGVLGGLIGILNVSALGALAYVSYIKWDRAH